MCWWSMCSLLSTTKMKRLGGSSCTFWSISLFLSHVSRIWSSLSSIRYVLRWFRNKAPFPSISPLRCISSICSSSPTGKMTSFTMWSSLAVSASWMCGSLTLIHIKSPRCNQYNTHNNHYHGPLGKPLSMFPVGISVPASHPFSSSWLVFPAGSLIYCLPW